jgi:hypothetical protein
MRLSDQLAAACGSNSDIGGILSRISAAIAKAERFELSDDVARAGYNLIKSKPTTLLNAMPLCRAPFRKLWLEWRGGLTRDMMRPEHRRDPLIAPDPLRQGVLIETDETGQRGTMTFAWVHKQRPDTDFSPVNVDPLGSLFNWSDDGDVREDAIASWQERYPTPELRKSPAGICELMLARRYTRQMTDEAAKSMMQRSVFRDWSRLSRDADQREALRRIDAHGIAWISPHAGGFFKWCAEEAMQDERLFHTFLHDVIEKSWEADIEGEPQFCEAVIAMMNSRNAIEHRDVDLSGLNKARIKRKRPAFLPYRTTHLRLSQAQTRAFRAGLLSREDAGLHAVRGHFKIRKTGVYWWHPFFRGDPTRPLQRQEYKVEQ